MNVDLDQEMRFWCELLGVTPANGWTISWRWVDDLRAPSGSPAYGLNEVDGAAKQSDIKIRKVRSPLDAAEFEDTCAHEVVHCLGAHMEALLAAGREVDAHEYLAETLAPALIKIKNTPRAKALAKAVKQLPERAKGNAKMDAMKLLLALCQGLMGMANLPEEAKALIEPVLAEAAKGSSDGAPPSEAMPAAAAPAEGEPKPPVMPPVAAAAPLEPGFAKAVDVLLGARPDLSEAQSGFVKTHCKTLDDAASYIGTIPVPAPRQAPAKPAAAPLADAPRGGDVSGTRLLSKIGDRLIVAKAMGQSTEPKTGPSIVEKDGGRYFTLGALTPKQWRAKLAAGWDPKKEFPLANEVLQ